MRYVVADRSIFLLHLLPLQPPVLDLAIDLENLLPIELLRLGVDLLVLLVKTVGLMLKRLALADSVLLNSVALFLENVVHLHRGNLQILPTF
jgi:hypothetical protein